MTYFDERYDLPAGEIVSIRFGPFGGLLRHYGVVTLRGTVISNSRAGEGVVEQSLKAFQNGQDLRRHGASSSQHPFIVEARARRKLGRSYDLTGSNCIDFTRYTHKRSATPWQLGKATLMAARDMFGAAKRRY